MAMTGQDRHLRRLSRLATGAMGAANRAVIAGAEMIRAEADRSLSRGSGKGIAPSPSGEPQLRLRTTNPHPLVAEVRGEAGYAAALEFGTSQLAARPYLRPARDKAAPAIRRLLADHMNALVKRS